MSNLRILYDNAADRATLTASSAAGALAAANLQTDTKSEVWRATALAASIYAAWPAAEAIQAVAFPFCNLSPTATMRVRVTTEASVTNLFTCSEQYDAADWLKSRLAITSTSAIAPDGSANATVMAGDGSGASYLSQSRTLNVGASYPVSCFVKAGTFTGGFLIRDFTESGDVTFNLTSLAVTTTGTFSNGKATAVGGGWYRVSATITPTTAGLHNVGLWVATTTGTVQIWGAMLASGSGSLTSYYPSFSAFSARTSTATYLASDGTVKVAAAGAARMQYTASNLQAPPKPLFEAAATNLVTASGTMTTGWSGNCSVTPAATSYRGIATYQSIKKTVTTPSENKTFSLGAAAQGSTYTMSVAVRADTSSTVSLGLFDTGNSSWGTAAESTLTFLEGSATVTQSNGLFTLSGLSATTDTVVQISRTFSMTGAIARVSIYPGGASSVTFGDAVLATRVQGEAGLYATSYIPTTTAAVARAADTYTTAAGVRPLGYIDTWQSYNYDSGAVLACPAPALRPRGWTAAQAASAYAYGGGAYARMWLPTALQATGLAVDIVDANNAQGYIEAARLVAGPYWAPTYNASEASMSIVDTTELYRTDAGDQGASAGYQYRRVPISLSAMPAADRAAFVNIVRNSRAAPILLSVFPDSADLALERDHMVYGRRSKDSDVAIQYAASYSTAVEIEEI